MKAQSVCTSTALTTYSLGSRMERVVSIKHRPHYSGKENQYPLYRTPGGLLGQSGQVGKISHSLAPNRRLKLGPSIP